MSTLFRFELKKIVANKVFIISCLLFLIISFMFPYFEYTSNSYSFTNKDGTASSDNKDVKITGKKIIDRNRKYSELFDGLAVDNAFIEKFEKMSMDSYIPDANGNIDLDKMLFGTSIFDFVNILKNNNAQMYKTDFSEATYTIPEGFWGDSGTPVYRYTEGWQMIIKKLPGFNQLVLLITIIICARSVSSEYSTGMINILLPTEHGKTKLITAKLLSALMVAVIVFVVISLLCIVLFGTIWGFDNPQADIRVFSSGAYLHLGTSMTCVELVLSELAVNLCSVILTVFICMFISSVAKNSFVSLIISFAVIFAPSLMNGISISSDIVKRILVLQPLNMSSIMVGDWNSYKFPLDIYILVPLITLLVSSASIIGTYTFIRRHKAAK